MASWGEVGRWCSTKARHLQDEWDVQAPIRGSMPSTEIEHSVDEWCAELALNTRALPVARDVDKPWIVVRLIVGGAMGRAFQEQPDILPIQDSGAALRILLIARWHRGGGRELWSRLEPVEK